jgi:hypothetical protein
LVSLRTKEQSKPSAWRLCRAWHNSVLGAVKEILHRGDNACMNFSILEQRNQIGWFALYKFDHWVLKAVKHGNSVEIRHFAYFKH